jgi:thiosulfate/3-mercaptopyruvate sulfurtransferase
MYETLITAGDLARALTAGEPVRILDCRGRLDDPGYGRRAWQEGHIPGAVYASIDDDFAGPPGPGGRHPLPERARLAARLSELGVGDAHQVVVYDDAGGAFAARAWWCLRWLGHAGVAVLDGGFAAWDGPLSRETPNHPQARFTLRPALTRSIDVAELERRLGRVALVDARAQPRFEGREEPIDPVAGHIPGAVCMPFQGNLGADGRFRSPAELAARFADLPGEVVCYCGSGVSATHNILAMRLAGRPEPILYPGSWSEWITDPSRPREPR